MLLLLLLLYTLHLSVRMLLLLLLPRALHARRRVRRRGLRGWGLARRCRYGIRRGGHGLWLAVRLEVELAEGGEIADGGQAVLLWGQRRDVVCVRMGVLGEAVAVAMGHWVAAGRTCDGCRRKHGLRRQRRHAAGSRTLLSVYPCGIAASSLPAHSRRSRGRIATLRVASMVSPNRLIAIMSG